MPAPSNADGFAFLPPELVARVVTGIERQYTDDCIVEVWAMGRLWVQGWVAGSSFSSFDRECREKVRNLLHN